MYTAALQSKFEQISTTQGGGSGGGLEDTREDPVGAKASTEIRTKPKPGYMASTVTATSKQKSVKGTEGEAVLRGGGSSVRRRSTGGVKKASYMQIKKTSKAVMANGTPAGASASMNPGAVMAAVTRAIGFCSRTSLGGSALIDITGSMMEKKVGERIWDTTCNGVVHQHVHTSARALHTHTKQRQTRHGTPNPPPTHTHTHTHTHTPPLSIRPPSFLYFLQWWMTQTSLGGSKR